MATLRAAVKSTLSGDSTLATLLPGGVYDTEDFTFDEGGANEVPRKANGVEVNPFAYVRFREADPYGPYLVQGEMQSIEIYVYDNYGYATLESAISRIKALLHFQEVSADDRQLAFLVTAHISGELNAPELGNIPCQFIRFRNTQIR